MPPKYVRPTHFLAFPISNPSCQAKAQEVIDVLLQAKPRPDGVHESLVAAPQSLHLTLGIMSLMTDKEAQTAASTSGQYLFYGFQLSSLSTIDAGQASKPRKTVKDAAKLLRECQTGLREILEEDDTSQIKINLNRLESFQSDSQKCRVLYAEPEKGSEGVETLHALAGTWNLLSREHVS